MSKSKSTFSSTSSDQYINISNLPSPERITLSSSDKLDKLVLTPTKQWKQSSGYMTNEYQCNSDEVPEQLSSVSSDILFTIEDEDDDLTRWKCILVNKSTFTPGKSTHNCHVELHKPRTATATATETTNSNSNSFDIYSLDDVKVTSDIFNIRQQAELYNDDTWKPISISMRTLDDREICTDASGWWDPKHPVMYDTTTNDSRPDRYEIHSKSMNKKENGEIVYKNVVVTQVDA